MHILGNEIAIFRKTSVSRGSAVVSSNRALISFYKLPKVGLTMPLTEAVWPHIPMLVFEVQSVFLFGKIGSFRGPTWHHRVAVGQPSLHFRTVFP